MSRLNGYLALLFLAGSAFALPLSAEEITVTIPPDPPAQTATSDAPEAPSTALPLFAAGNSAPAPVAQDATSPPPETQQEAAPPQAAPAPATESAPAVAPEAPKHQAKTKKTTAPAAEPGAPAHATAPAAKPKVKKASAAASCKGLDESACGGNSACIWVVGTPAEGSSKGSTAGCRSLAAMKREAKKADKAAKSGEPEVLPWASHTSSTPQSGAGAASTSDGSAKPTAAKKTKAATTNKAAKPKEAAPPAASEGGDQAAPSSDAPAASSGSD